MEADFERPCASQPSASTRWYVKAAGSATISGDGTRLGAPAPAGCPACDPAGGVAAELQCYAETSRPRPCDPRVWRARWLLVSRYLSHGHPAAAMVDQTLHLLVCRFGAPTCRLLFAARRVELSELPWTSRVKVSRQSRVRPTAIRVGLGAQALSVCAARETPCEARTRAIGCTVPCLYTGTIHCSSFLCLPRTVRVSSQSRARETHTHTLHTHRARAPHSGQRARRARPGGSLEGSVCYCVHCILIHGYEQLDREAACMYTASRRQRG